MNSSEPAKWEDFSVNVRNRLAKHAAKFRNQDYLFFTQFKRDAYREEVELNKSVMAAIGWKHEEIDAEHFLAYVNMLEGIATLWRKRKNSTLQEVYNAYTKIVNNEIHGIAAHMHGLTSSQIQPTSSESFAEKLDKASAQQLNRKAVQIPHSAEPHKLSKLLPLDDFVKYNGTANWVPTILRARSFLNVRQAAFEEANKKGWVTEEVQAFERKKHGYKTLGAVIKGSGKQL